MSSIIPSLLRLTAYKSPFLSTLVPSIGLAYGLQAAVAIPSIFAQSERFYDLSGSLTYISCTALSLYLPTLRARYAAAAAGAAKPAWPSLLAALQGAGGAGLNWRQVVLSAAVSIWATRCKFRQINVLFLNRTAVYFASHKCIYVLISSCTVGTYLFKRVLSTGEDSRFKDIRNSPPAFAVAFFAQATWVSLCLLPILSINALPASLLATLPTATLITDVIGLALYAGGLGFEVTADRQKDKWLTEKREKKHEEDFLTRGLWSKSRHPNYFGEVTLWSGIAVTSAGVMMRHIGQVGIGLAKYGVWGKVAAAGMAGISPAFVAFLLLKVSGVPMSEGKYDKKYGDRKEYREWKDNTPMFIPKF